jgi:2-oxoisovalerate dehydrogenase E1 component beta subunit
MPEVTMVGAVTQAIGRALEDDENVVLLGEDVGMNGGVFRATEGLQQRFGSARVIDTPLAEAGIAGTAIGMAAAGLKPIAEFQFMGFIYSAVDQIISHASRMRNRTRGRVSCPMVIRAPYGGGIHGPEHHSESTEAMFAHMPGLRVVIPSSPIRAYGLLLAAIQNPDPVLFLEPKRVYRTVKQDVPDDGVALPLDLCFTVREGSDITLVTWGAMVTETLAAAEKLSDLGIEAEVIDVATITPLDMDTILKSVEKTGRCVIIHEAPYTGGFGAEIAARLAEKALLDLLSPVLRVTGYDVIMPTPRTEYYYYVTEERIIEAARKTVAFPEIPDDLASSASDAA